MFHLAIGLLGRLAAQLSSSAPPAHDPAFLLEDGTSFFLLEDGSLFLLG